MSIDERLRDGLARNAAHMTAAIEPVLESVLRRRRAQVRRRVAGGVVGLATLAALAPLAYDGVRPADEPTPVSPSDALVGTFVVDTSVLGDAGQWKVTVTAVGGMEIEPPDRAGTQTALATYTVDEGVLRTNAFLDSPGCQLPEAYVGTYTWTRAGDTLRFAVVSDTCVPRRELFGATWEEVQP